MKEYICIVGANSAIAKAFIKKIENFNLILLDKDEINTKHEFIRIDALDLNSIIVSIERENVTKSFKDG